MCVNSCVVTTAYVLLLLAVLACALSYVAPFWILFTTLSGLVIDPMGLVIDKLASTYRIEWKDTRLHLGIAGLWAACDSDYDNCGWFWQNEFYAEKNLPGTAASFGYFSQ